jgi:Flp pilus assembly pilin Flp
MRSWYWKTYLGLQDLLKREEGLDLAEFSLITALVSVAGIAMLGGIATKVVNMLTSLNTAY